MNSQIPVALFAYNRPDLLDRTIESLRGNSVPRIYAFSDGPKSAEHEPSVQAVKARLRAIDWCDVILYERSTNLGLGRSILDGVGRVLQEHEAVLVFEDDLVCVPGAYRYLVSALLHYWDDPRVLSVTGWTHPQIAPSGLNDMPYFDGRAECWVFGTWARSWKNLEEPALERLRRHPASNLRFDWHGTDIPKLAAEERAKNLWSPRWLYHHLLLGGLCLRPPWSLVEHLGFDERATTSAGAWDWANPPLASCPPLPSRWPEPVEHPDCAPLWRRAVAGEPERTLLSAGPGPLSTRASE